MDWDRRYAQFDRCFGDGPSPFVREALSSLALEGMTLLFPGDGYGRNGLWAAQRGASVVAVEGSRIAVEMARAEAAHQGLDYRSFLCDLSSPPLPVFEEHFDMVVSAWFRIEADSTDPQRSWNVHATKMLRPDGLIVLVGSQAMEPAASEMRLWPAEVTWTDCSTDEETRLIGRLSCSY